MIPRLARSVSVPRGQRCERGGGAVLGKTLQPSLYSRKLSHELAAEIPAAFIWERSRQGRHPSCMSEMSWREPAMAHVLLTDDDPALIPEQVRQSFPGPRHRIEVAGTGGEG